MTAWKHALVLATMTALAVPPVLLAQDQQPGAGPTPSAIAGAWRLNRELSTKPPDEMPSLAKKTGEDKGSATNVQPGGGLSQSEDDKRVLRDILKEASEPPGQIVISVGQNKVTILDSTGLVRTFDTTYKKEKQSSTAGPIETRTKWEGQALVIEATSAGVKVRRVYRPAPEGGRLVVAVTVEGVGRLPQTVPPMLFAYDPAR